MLNHNNKKSTKKSSMKKYFFGIVLTMLGALNSFGALAIYHTTNSISYSTNDSTGVVTATLQIGGAVWGTNGASPLAATNARTIATGPVRFLSIAVVTNGNPAAAEGIDMQLIDSATSSNYGTRTVTYVTSTNWTAGFGYGGTGPTATGAKVLGTNFSGVTYAESMLFTNTYTGDVTFLSTNITASFFYYPRYWYSSQNPSGVTNTYWTRYGLSIMGTNSYVSNQMTITVKFDNNLSGL